MRNSPHAISRTFAKQNELPTLAATTSSDKLAARIHREIGTKETA